MNKNIVEETKSNNDLTEKVSNDGLSNADLKNMRDGENDPESKTSTQSINVEPNTQ